MQPPGIGLPLYNHSNEQVAVKLADQTFTSTTLADVDDLFFLVGANQEWWFETRLTHKESTQETTRIAFTVPSGATGERIHVNHQDQVEGKEDLTSTQFIAPDGTNNGVVVIHAIIRNGATAGIVQLQTAQGTATGVLTIGRASIIIARRAF